MASPDEWSATRNWRKLHARIPEHEKSKYHKSCYLQWKTEQRKHLEKKYLSKTIKDEQEVCHSILLQVMLFLAERETFIIPRNTNNSNKIDDYANDNFLDILELLIKYDPVLTEHLQYVQHSQETSHILI